MRAPAAPRRHRPALGDHRPDPRLQPRLRRPDDRPDQGLRRAHRTPRPDRGRRPRRLCRAARRHRRALRQHAHRLHPGAGPGLPDHRRPAAARRLARPHRRRHQGSDGRPARAAACRPYRGLRRPRWRHLHQRAQCRRHLHHPRPLRPSAATPDASATGRAPGLPGPPRRNPGSQHLRHRPAPGARRRHRRRLEALRPGPGSAGRRGARGRRRPAHRRAQPDRRPRPCLHPLQHPHAAHLRRYRPGPRRAAGRPGRARHRDARGLSGLGLRQRLQLHRPHLPGHRPGRRPLPQRPRRRRPLRHPLDQRRHGPARPPSPASRNEPAPTASPATTSSPPPRCRVRPPPAPAPARPSAAVEQVAAEVLPDGFAIEWTELALQEKLAGNTTIIAFTLSVLFVFLVLAALYESWLLPLGRHPHRADVPAGRPARRQPPRHGQQRPGADRLHRADRLGRQERHPHRRVRQAGRGRARPDAHRRRRRGRPHPAAPDPHDLARLHPRRRAAAPRRRAPAPSSARPWAPPSSSA